MTAPFLVSTTLCGAEGVGTIGEALRSIAPHVDAVIVITTDADTAEEISRITEAVRDTSPASFFCRHWPWQNDFGAARNAALDLAASFGATWCVWVDSDETIEGGDEIRPFLRALTDHPLHVLREGQPTEVREDKAAMMPHASGSYYQPRAIRLPCAERWAGRVHEAIGLSGPRFHRARFCDRPKTPEQMYRKRTRDIEALRLMLIEQPDEPRWRYYLADAYAGIGNHEAGATHFQTCALQPGWDEQAAWAAYRAAEILTSVLGDHDRAVEMCGAGLARHAGIAELAWMASLASYRAGRFEQALHWSKLADVHGAPGLGGDGRALRSRVLFREPKGLTFGPAEVREHALRALGEHEAAERAANLRRLRLGDVESLSGVVDVGPESEEP